jgi:cytochrome c553
MESRMNFGWLMALVAGALGPSVASAQGVSAADLAKAQQTATRTCAACHGADGNSTLAANPVLAGQHADYTLKQLTNFSPRDGKPAERPNAVMGGMVATLSADDQRDLAAYFEMQRPTPRMARDADLVKLGQAIYRGGILSKNVAACSACHGPNGSGMPSQFPRLAGQFADYTAAQLRAFRSGERANDPNRMMRAVADKLSDREIAAVAEYISGLR